MRKKRNEWIGMLMMVLVLIAGVYGSNAKAASLSMCAPMQTTNSYRSSIDTVIRNMEMGTIEMIGICDNTNQEQLAIRFQNQNRDTKIFPDFLYQVITSQKEEQSYVSVKKIQIVSKIQDTLVINYIHEIDGKKNLL